MNAAVQRRLVIGLITLATLNALLWSVIAAPGGGGPDEPSHMRIVRTMLATGGLAEFRGYSPGAFAGGPVRAQVAHEITPNAFAVPVAVVIGLLGSDDDAFNHHMARLFSVALYPVTLWLAFLTLRRLFADMPVAPVWGVALMATAPMFTLVHSYYTNDTPAIAASTFAVYALVRASQSDFALRDSALLGVALGLVGLHKYTGFLVFPVAALVLVWQLWRQPARLMRTGGAMLGIVAAIASWWYVRNWVLYGDPIGVAFTQAAVDATGGAPVPPRARGLNPVEFVQETNWIGENFATFWGGYGKHTMKLPGAAYLAFSALLITAVAGWSIRAVRALRNGVDLARPPLLVIMALLHVGLWCLSFWSSYTVDVALHGRYVFPTFLPFVVLVIAGLSSFIAWRGRAELAVLATIPVMLAANGTYFVQTLLPHVLA